MPLVNPALLASFDANQTNTATPPVGQQTDGYGVNEIPLSEHHGFMFNQFYSWLNYLKSAGISQWDIGVTYSENARIMRDQNIYRSLQNANLSNDPLTNPDKWQIDQWRMNTAIHNITVDSDYTLTVKQNNFGKVIINDTGVVLTGAINIIVSDEEKDFILHNATAQDLTVKTAAGTGVLIPASEKKWLLCDGTNVIIAVEGIEIASTVEAQTGTNNSKAITPLRLHEAMLGGVAQSWQDVTASRALGVQYTNNTGRPIEVKVRTTGLNKTSTLTVDGMILDYSYISTTNVANERTESAIVPDGSTYQMGALTTLTAWHELR
jgi:hypothetical protein